MGKIKQQPKEFGAKIDRLMKTFMLKAHTRLATKVVWRALHKLLP
jgi:hypothetical protein